MRKKIILLAGIMTALSSCVPLVTAAALPVAIGAEAVNGIGHAFEKKLLLNQVKWKHLVI